MFLNRIAFHCFYGCFQWGMQFKIETVKPRYYTVIGMTNLLYTAKSDGCTLKCSSELILQAFCFIGCFTSDLQTL